MNKYFENLNPEAWNTTKVFADSIADSALFPRPMRPSDALLRHVHQKLEQLILVKELNKSNVTIKEQRVLPWILLPCLKGNFVGLLSMTGAWAQVLRLLTEKTRYDPLTLEALAYEWDERAPSHLLSAQQIATQIEKMLSMSQAARAQRTLNNLTINADAKGTPISWAESIVLRGRQKLEKIYDSFNTLSITYHQDRNLDGSINKDRAKFWRCYFTQGLVKNCWLACDSETKRSYMGDKHNVLELSGCDQSQSAIIFQLGDLIVVEWLKPIGFCIHKPSERLQLSLRSGKIDIDELNAGIISKHKFSSMGYWQYIVSSTLKKETQFMPTRASYL